MDVTEFRDPVDDVAFGMPEALPAVRWATFAGPLVE